jgi:hypothetical protein
MDPAPHAPLIDEDDGPRRAPLRPPTGADELSAAEAGPPLARAMRLAAACAPGLDVTALTLGDFNRLALALHALIFPGPAEAVADCPARGCGARMDVALDVAAVLGAVSAPARETAARILIGGRQHVARLRPLRARDMVAAATEADEAAGRRGLIAAALVDLRAEDGAAPASAALLMDDPDATAAVETAMLEADPFARLTARGVCPTCGAETALAFDPPGFLVERLGDGERLLDEVDRIARAYHWSETEILSLPMARRRAYLRRIAAADAPARSWRGAA